MSFMLNRNKCATENNLKDGYIVEFISQDGLNMYIYVLHCLKVFSHQQDSYHHSFLEKVF
jgi:hypothetical protein